MDKREKLKESFKQSKAKLKVWETSFFAEHQRKPSKEEIKTAPEQIQICYKNCWKIKSYFESHQNEKENTILDETSQNIDLSKAPIDDNVDQSQSDMSSFAGALDNSTATATSLKKETNVLKAGSGNVRFSEMMIKPVNGIFTLRCVGIPFEQANFETI